MAIIAPRGQLAIAICGGVWLYCEYTAGSPDLSVISTTAALRQAHADVYSDSAGYLAGAVEFGLPHCDVSQPTLPAPSGRAELAAAARRVDDTFRD